MRLVEARSDGSDEGSGDCPARAEDGREGERGKGQEERTREVKSGKVSIYSPFPPTRCRTREVRTCREHRELQRRSRKRGSSIALFGSEESTRTAQLRVWRLRSRHCNGRRVSTSCSTRPPPFICCRCLLLPPARP